MGLIVVHFESIISETTQNMKVKLDGFVKFEQHFLKILSNPEMVKLDSFTKLVELTQNDPGPSYWKPQIEYLNYTNLKHFYSANVL